MAQDWQGSDISYNDLARSDDVLDNYEIEVVTIEEREGRSVYWLDAIPGEETPVVWGKESFEIKVIDDEYVLLSQTFYDQDMNPVKRWKTLEIGELGGRTIPLKMRMYNVDETESWTQIEYNIAEFDIDVDDRLFTQFALRGEL